MDSKTHRRHKPNGIRESCLDPDLIKSGVGKKKTLHMNRKD